MIDMMIDEVNNYYFSLLAKCKHFARIDYNSIDYNNIFDSYIFDEDDMWDIIFSELLKDFDNE